MMRRPAVAGTFYPSEPEEIKEQIAGFSDKAAEKVDALGIISPHAGYIYSGAVAGSVYSRIKPKPVYVILGPNHTGHGKPFSIMSRGEWEMPQGSVSIDSALAGELVRNSGLLKDDDLAHEDEHSIEAQMPFLQYPGKPFTFVPIVISYAGLKQYQALGREIAGAILKTKKDVMIIASSDMTHYEAQDNAGRKDKAAIEAILSLDEKMLFETVENLRISMCGCAPVCAMLAAVKALGAESAELTGYRTSGDASGDYSSVVGYAGVIIKG
ncbi:MAG: AmmeMemoRadiSam system protein B [Candidatus Omnitrophota bacterium]